MSSINGREVVEFGPFRLYFRQRRLLCQNTAVPIGGRGMDVLLALAENDGRLVTKEQLLAAAWPNVFVHESNLKVTVASLRRALRAHSPHGEFIITVVGRGYWLDTATPTHDSADVPDLSLLVGSQLPELGRVIGRDAVIAGLCETLARSRLTTVVGAGGVGKTTVAVAAAQVFEGKAGVTTTFVDLSRVAGNEFVVATLAAALSVSSDGSDNLRAIVSILRKRRSLLLFDTCEHVLSEVAQICNVVLANTPDVRILATSRQMLSVQQEKVIWLQPLDVPPLDHADTAAGVLKYSGPQLLAARAFEKSGYCVQDSEARAIAGICRRLDGSPLAIELVAHRLASSDGDTVLNELDDRFGILRRSVPGGPLRHQTLLLTLEWSYALLTEIEATVFRTISVFAGSFDADAANHVLSHRGIAPIDTFDAISGLRAKSMLSLDTSSGGLRYRLLDSTRAFASSLLDAHGETATVSGGHSQLQLEIQTRAGTEHATTTPRNWHAMYGGQADDLRKAVYWALDRSGAALLGIQLVATSVPFWQELSLFEEARRNCKHALAACDRLGIRDTSIRLKLVLGLAAGSAYLCTAPETAHEMVAVFEEAIRLAREVADPVAEFRALYSLAVFKLLPGHPSGHQALQEMRKAAVRSNDRSVLLEEEQLRAQWEVLVGRLAAASARLKRLNAQVRSQSVDTMPRFHIHTKASIVVQMGALSWLMGRPTEALHLVEEAAREAIQSRHGLSVIHCLARGVIFTLEECEEYGKARCFADQLMQTIHRHGMADWIPIAECYSQAIDASSGVRRSPVGLRRAVRDLQAATVHHSYFATIIKAMLAIGEVEDAASTLDFVFRHNPQRWNLPELLRLRAASERAFGRDDSAKALLVKAVHIADKMGSLAWKLRAALDLASLLRARGSSLQARQALAPVYEQFIDDGSTGDLRRSRNLLAQLA